MNSSTSRNLLERVRAAAAALGPELANFAPVIEGEVYGALSREVVQCLQGVPEAEGLLLADAKTSQALGLSAAFGHGAIHFVLAGEKPTSPEPAAAEKSAAAPLAIMENDRLFIIATKHFSFVLLGTEEAENAGGQDEFSGGWSADSVVVHEAARLLLADAGTLLPPAEAAHACAGPLTMRLVALHAQSLVTRHRSIAKDKDDLSAVLKILKAISAKRRAHDVLLVFVQQIAKVVPADRCSVVRVWGGERFGHVLASHEDKNVHAHNIELERYPELYRAMNTRSTVVIDDVSAHSLTRPFADDLATANIHALLVIPIVLFDESVGSLFLRAARSEGHFSQEEISFFEIVAEAAGNAIERAQLFENIQAANEHLERLAITDGLTGLYNHRHFRGRLDEEFERGQRYNLPLSCLIFDVDDFKAINDAHGHLCGDEILREVARRTLFCIRNSDFVARYGGEEFVIILPQTGLKGAIAEAERLRSAIAAGPFTGCSEEISVTVSVGAGTLDTQAMNDCEDILRAADKALYEAKAAGKNCVYPTAR